MANPEEAQDGQAQADYEPVPNPRVWCQSTVRHNIGRQEFGLELFAGLQKFTACADERANTCVGGAYGCSTELERAHSGYFKVLVRRD